MYILFDVPPASGFVTLIGRLPASLTRYAGTSARNSVLETNVVTRFDDEKLIWLPDLKFTPKTLRVNDGPPALTLEGLIVRMNGF